MNEIIENKKIEEMIYEIRGKQVILDSDLAKLYECANGTRTINQAVKRHLNKFPERYMFQLTKAEFLNLKSQLGTSSYNNYGGIRKLPFVFTEQGVAMLATILRTNIADTVSMQIIDAFVYMRHYLSYENKENMLINHENRILKLEESFNKLEEKSKLNTIIYEGKVYDAYSILLDIFNLAKEEIIIIDNYANKELFDILRNINKHIIIISKNLDDILISKYQKQYDNIVFIKNAMFHDRYLILDKKLIYGSGMSLKDLGKKYSFIYKMEEKLFIDDLLNKVSEILK